MKKFYLIPALALLVLVSACNKAKVAGPPKESIFRYGIEAKIPSLDPHVTHDVYSTQTQGLVYESLYHYDYLKRPYEVVPVLAGSLPKWSADHKTMTIALKKGVHFQDDPCFEATQGKGREMNADDAIYSLHRIASSKIQSTIYGSFEGKVVGIDDYHLGKAQTISGIRKVDDYTFEMKLTQVLPRFIYNFTDMKTAILPKECVEKYGDQLARHPVGTGPFIIKQADLSYRVEAVRNPNYTTQKYPTQGNPGDEQKGLLVDAGKPLPLVDKVIFEVVPERQPAWLKFLAGEFEISKVPKDSIPSVLPNNELAPEYKQKGIQHFRQVTGDVTVHIFNMRDPVWGKKKELRQAFALALDIPKIIEIQYSNQAVPAQSIIDPTMYGYDPSYKSPWSTRNVEKAKQLLAKAGYPEGKGLPPVVMPTGSDTTARHLDELLTRQLAEVGIVLKPEAMTWPELESRLRKGNFVVCGIGYSSGVPDFDDSSGIISSKYIATGVNAAAYSNPEVDKLVDEIERLEDGPARMAKIKRVRAILEDELPYIPMVHRIGNQLIQPWVKNHVYIDNMVFGRFVKYQRVDAAK